MAIDPPLRVLVILSAPTDHAPQLQVDEEWQRIRAALSPLVENRKIEIDRLQQATWSELQSYLRKETAHVLHFVGHGQYDPESEGAQDLQQRGSYPLELLGPGRSVVMDDDHRWPPDAYLR